MLLDVLGFRQSDDSRCGVASVKSVLYYYGIDATEDEIAIRCNHTYELGCTNENMKSAIESYGLGAVLYKNCSLDDLRYWNKHKTPVIVDFFTPSFNPFDGDMPNGHSGVIVDIDRNNVYLLDPENGKARMIKNEDFERVWFDWSGTANIENNTINNVGVIIVPFPIKLKTI